MDTQTGKTGSGFLVARLHERERERERERGGEGERQRQTDRQRQREREMLLKCCFTSTETVG